MVTLSLEEVFPKWKVGTADWVQLLVLADQFEDNQEDNLARTLRWMAKNKRYPVYGEWGLKAYWLSEEYEKNWVKQDYPHAVLLLKVFRHMPQTYVSIETDYIVCKTLVEAIVELDKALTQEKVL